MISSAVVPAVVAAVVPAVVPAVVAAVVVDVVAHAVNASSITTAINAQQSRLAFFIQLNLLIFGENLEKGDLYSYYELDENQSRALPYYVTICI
jgi:hypothetical protein